MVQDELVIEALLPRYSIHFVLAEPQKRFTPNNIK